MNTKKRRILIAALLVACLAITGMGSLAYFSAEGTAHNVITSGSIKSELKEWADEEKTVPFPEEGIQNVMPGDEVTKIVELTNTGTGTAWVRMKVEKAITLAEGQVGEVNLEVVKLNIDTEKWTEKDGWFYYTEPLQPGDTTAPLFTVVSFDVNMSNLYQKCTATVDVTAQSVQAAHNGENALEAAGWPEG